jgi:hypothetical protein
VELVQRSLLRKFLDWCAHGDRPWPPPEPTKLEQLVEAREKLRRQIEILDFGPVLGRDATPQTPRLITELEEALKEVEAEIAEIEPAEDPAPR